MKLDHFLQFLVPKDKKFFPLFERGAANLLLASDVLHQALNTTSHDLRKEKIKEIERLEHIGDGISHEIYHELDSTFITPFDREDIHKLASAIDDVLDFIHGSSKRIDLYKIEVIPEPAIKLSELILRGAEELNKAVLELRNMKNVSNIREACIKINSIENHADDIYNMAIARLFDEEKDAIAIIKHKEVLSALEKATDKCEDAANVLESILIKTA